MIRRAALWVCLTLVACGGPEGEAEKAPPEEVPAQPAPAPDEAKTARPTGTARPAAHPTPDFRLSLDPGAHTVRGELQLEVPTADTVILAFRADWPGYPELGERLRSVEAWSGSGALSVIRSPGDGRHAIPVAEASTVTVSFELRLGPPSETRLYHRVSQVSPQGGHLIGRDLLPSVRLSSSGHLPSREARVWFTGLPSTWRVITVARRSGNAYELADVRQAMFAVGPLRTRQFNIGPRAVTVAILGDWSVSDDRIFAALRKLADVLHGIGGSGWRDGPYLIIAGRTPPGPQGLSTGGQVVDRSALVYVGGTWPGTLAFERWLHTAAHELMHWYIPTAFRFDGGPPSWFAEGLTDYMALKSMLVADLATPEGFLAEMGERIARYRSSPLYETASMAEAQTDLWENDAYRFIYDGGTSAAFLLDLGLQGRRASLEHALRQLMRAGVLNEERIVRQLSTVGENEWIREWLAVGSNPDWKDRLSRYGLRLEGSTLTATDSWATDVLSSIRP